MESLSDLSKYHELRKRIIRNEELSDAEWELFFELEMKNREMKHQKETWDNLFVNSIILPDQKEPSAKKSFYYKEFFIGLKSLTFRKYHFAYAGLVLFFIIGFLSYSMFDRQADNSPQVSTLASVENNEIQDLESPEKQNQPSVSSDNGLLAYAENPFLENYISDVVRSVSDNMEISSPQPSLRYKLKEDADSLTINFSGTLFSETADNIFLKIFSNKVDEYSNDQPIYMELIRFEKKGAGFSFSKKVSYSAAKGLYYFTIENGVEDVVLYMNKFYIY